MRIKGVKVTVDMRRVNNRGVLWNSMLLKAEIRWLVKWRSAGAKNAALAILSAAIMTDETILIENLPDVRDINVLLEAIAGIGAQVEQSKQVNC